MPELPEVETTRRGIEPHLRGRRITSLLVRERRLRWPVPHGLEAMLPGRSIRAVQRRAKYLLLRLDGGGLILHLGMSGSLRILPRMPALTAGLSGSDARFFYSGQTRPRHRLSDLPRIGASGQGRPRVRL